MRNVVSWIRECDGPYFRRFSELHPDLRLLDARTERVDFAAMDGLLLTGGEDIAAEFLKQEVAAPSQIENPVPERDAWEFAALPYALAGGLPVFAICKGHQVLNVALGGTLHLDIPGHDLPEMKTQNIQPLRYASDAGHRFALVNSSHHQSIDKLGDGLEIEAWCADDDIIEQVRLRDYPFCLGVQYHPERDMIYAPLFEDFFGHVRETHLP
jgi:putative glutamine amidotransferase